MLNCCVWMVPCPCLVIRTIGERIKIFFLAIRIPTEKVKGWWVKENGFQNVLTVCILLLDIPYGEEI